MARPEPAMTAARPSAPVLGLLHTGAIHPPVFDALVADALAGDEQLPGAEIVHITDAWLLDTAISTGITDQVRDRIAGHVAALAARDATAVLITCSSIGEVTEEVAAVAPVPVLRVDLAMARSAVRIADQQRMPITVLATLSSTVGPTTRLLERERRAAGAAVTLRSVVLEGAVARRDAGDQVGHDAQIATAVADARRSGALVVLAQASMARALPESDPLVLSSPDSAVAALLVAAR